MASIYDTVSGWAQTATYIKYNIVTGSDLKYYYSLIDANNGVGNNPTTQANLQSKWDGYRVVNGTLIPNFFWKPSYTSSINYEPNIIKLQFGNGYQQRIQNGINNELMKFDVSFDNRTELEAVSILHFLDQRGGQQGFVYNPPTLYNKTNFNTRFIASSWNVVFNSYNNYTIKTKLEEVAV